MHCIINHFMGDYWFVQYAYGFHCFTASWHTIFMSFSPQSQTFSACARSARKENSILKKVHTIKANRGILINSCFNTNLPVKSISWENYPFQVMFCNGWERERESSILKPFHHKLNQSLRSPMLMGIIIMIHDHRQ